MPRDKKPTFILDLPLVAQPTDDRVMFGRFEAGRRLLNAVLDEALKRLLLMRQSKAWQAARVMPKGTARSVAFKACNEHFGFSEYALQAVATKHKNAAGWQDRLGAHETQKIATRVWKAVSEYAFSGRGRPRFKGKSRPLHSLEGKNNVTGIRWQADIGCVTWNRLVLPVKMPNQQQDPYVHEALKSTTKYCRIVWRNIKGRRCWFVQLVQDGIAPAKYDFFANGQEVGLDIGPSTVAILGDEVVALERFAPSVDQPWAQMRRIQRAMDRSRRATNPDNYHANGIPKKGARTWKRSSGYRTWQVKLSELERKLAAARKKDHGTLVNNILGLGNVIKTETLSYKAFQRCFGRSAKVRASGAFVSLLTRKAESAGGKVIELDTRRLRMSQYDHVTSSCRKKPLKQRWHRIGGSKTLVQRDCYSAFLAKHAKGSEHNLSNLEQGWTAAEPLLRRARLCLEESANGMPSGSPTVVIPSERIARQRRFVRSLARDVVAVTREPGDPAHVRL